MTNFRATDAPIMDFGHKDCYDFYDEIIVNRFFFLPFRV